MSELNIEVQDIEVMHVNEYNQIQGARFARRVDEVKLGEPLPFLPMYLFLNEASEPRKRGYVVIENGSHYFVPNLEAANRKRIELAQKKRALST